MIVRDEQEEFEDTKGVIRICKSKKNRQHNGQKKKDKRTINYTTRPSKGRQLSVSCWRMSHPLSVKHNSQQLLINQIDRSGHCWAILYVLKPPPSGEPYFYMSYSRLASYHHEYNHNSIDTLDTLSVCFLFFYFLQYMYMENTMQCQKESKKKL